MSELDARNYDILTFDCYGTLVDWETAIVKYLQEVLLSHDVHVFDGTILEFYAEWEPLEQAAGGSYRDVLSRVMTRFGGRLGFTATAEETEGFVKAIATAQPFDDTVDALTKLKEHVELGIISNTDDDLIQMTLEPLGVDFTAVATAQKFGAYKPDIDMLKQAFEWISDENKRVLHVAESRFHDIAPATELGYDTVWINRTSEHASATREVDAEPTWTFEDLAQLVEAIQPD